MNDIKVAIILTTYNRSHLIRETLASIKNQSENDFKCYIIDDFSIDNTAEVVEQFIKTDARFSFHKKRPKEAKGLSASRNIGLDLIKNQGFGFIQFFDDDDIMHPEKLKIQLKDLSHHSNAKLSLCGSKNFENLHDITWKENTSDFQNISHDLWDAYLIGELKFVAQVPLFRSSFFTNYRFDEDLFYAEEWVLFVQQFYEEKPKFSVIEKVLFYRRKHDLSITAGGNRNFNVRKTSAIAGVKVFDFLTENRVHSKVSILHYTRYFLLYNYDSGLLKSIENEIKQFFPELKQRFWISLTIHKFFRKIILRILKY